MRTVGLGLSGSINWTPTEGLSLSFGSAEARVETALDFPSAWPALRVAPHGARWSAARPWVRRLSEPPASTACWSTGFMSVAERSGLSEPHHRAG